MNSPRARVLLWSRSRVFGGVEMRMGLEARVLARAGYSPTVATNLHPALEGWRRALEADGIPVEDFAPPPFLERWRRRRWNKLRARVSAAARLRALRPSLVHVFLPWTDSGGSRLWLAARCGLPVQLSVRNRFPRAEWSSWHARHYAEGFRAVRGVYAISRSALEGFVESFEPFLRQGTRLEVIENAVDLERFRPRPEARAAARRALGLPASAPVLGCVARLDEQKRPSALLDLAAALRPELPELRLVLVGEGPLEASLRDRARRLGIGDAVVFAGLRADVERCLPAFDVFVLLSRREGFGTATAEAMAAGLPVVATDVPGSRDILGGGEGGRLVPLEDTRAAAEACARWLRDPAARAAVGHAGRKEAERRFDQRQWEARILAFTGAMLGHA